MDGVKLEEVINRVNKFRGLLFQLTPCRSDKHCAEYSAHFENYGTLNLAFTNHFPLELPDIYVESPQRHQLHIDKKGKLCLVEESALLWNVNDPVQIILDYIDAAIKIISLSPDSDAYQKDLQREFFSYWGNESTFSITSILDVNSVKCEEYPLLVSGSKFLLANTLNEAEVFLQNSLHHLSKEKCHSFNALVVRLRENSGLPSPFHTYKWSEVRRYIQDNTSASTKKVFEKFISKKFKNKLLYFVLILPSHIGSILFGFRISFQSDKYIALKTAYSAKTSPLSVIRLDYDYLLHRSGAAPSLKNKRVLLMGCGSVGGYVAYNLCQMGIINLDIIDSDAFRAENIHRHVLGFDSFDDTHKKNKADLLKKKLEEQFAYVDIDSLNYLDRSVQAFLEDPERLSSYDVIISALGEPTINLKINEILHSNQISTPFVLCFNEPYGVGGHVIVCNLNKTSCLRCLYTDPQNGELVVFRGSFVAAGQNFHRSLSGCSGSFVPYSTLDSQLTANYTVRKCIEVLNGQLTCNQGYSWKGESTTLESLGFKVSSAYKNTPDSFRVISDWGNTRCPLCKTMSTT